MSFRLRALHIEDKAGALREIERTLADEAGVARMFEKARYMVLRVEGLKAAAGNILKQEMLSLGAEAAVARGVINCSVERTDVVLMGTRKQMRKLVNKLKPQPFGLKRLGDDIARLIKMDGCPMRYCTCSGEFDLSKGPLVMGIVNVTPDSFSDGGDNAETSTAVSSALAMAAQGADIVDVGGESTRPGAPPLGEAEELERVISVIRSIAENSGVAISVDTYKSSVARAAVEAGASIINDISGLNLDPEMAAVAADTGAALVLMHMRRTPADMQADTSYDDMVSEIYRLLSESVERALAAGVDESRIAIDPGIGFGKSVEGNLLLLRRLTEFRSMGLPILVGASRKSFIGKTLGIDEPKDRLEGSLAVAALAVSRGAAIVRAHDVLATRRAVDMAWAVAEAEEE